MKTFFSWLFRYDLFFRDSVQMFGRLQASALFGEHLSHHHLLATQEEIAALAHQKAEQFYQSGSIPIDSFLPFIRLRANRLGTHQQITDTYTDAFTDQYHYSLSRTQHAHS